MPNSSALDELLAGLNPGQRSALDSPARLVVVPACPGSGKTRLFVTAVAQRMLSSEGSVAALSFTNVAEQEVRKRLQGKVSGIGHPHFIGTIDTFLLRYVVKPFGHRTVNLANFTRPVDSRDDFIQSNSVPGMRTGNSLAQMSLIRNRGSVEVYFDKDKVENPRWVKDIISLKKQAWAKGHLTYDDVCFLAALLLEKDDVRRVVLSRFPIIFVDEFQDTGGSREDALLSLLADERLKKGMVVGDPDQCIMQFSHARPDLFNDVLQLEGASASPLTVTHRFHSGIASVTCHLAAACESLGTVPEPPSGESTSTILLTHDYTNRPNDLSGIPKAFASFVIRNGIANPENPSAILVWKRNTAWRIGGAANAANPKFKCRWLEALFASVRSFSAGNMADAFGRAERILSEASGFSSLSPNQQKLAEIGLTRQSWKAAVWGLVLASQPKPGEALEAWIARLKEDLKPCFRSVGADERSIPRGIKLQRASLGTAHLSTGVSALAVESGEARKGILVEKVHQVKGREFPAVCYFVPKPQSNEDGAVESWFGEWEKESARVSYVALTRAQKALMVVIPDSWHQELIASERGARFVASFEEVSSLADYLDSLAESAPGD